MEEKTFADIPAPYGTLFEHFQAFNILQTTLFNDLLNTDRSVVLSAPTGSGKTVAFELAIVRMLLANKDHNPSIPFKAIYVAPIKALCTEKIEDWKLRFEPLEVSCVQITGDTESTELRAIRNAHLVVTTPEKWDSLTRRWREYLDIVAAMRVFIVDEVHLLNEDVRGPILEAIVSRMQTIASACELFSLRFIVASATIPNIEDLTAWIGNGKNSTKEVVQSVFTDKHRPIPLEKHILGCNSKCKGFRFDISLNYKLPEIIRKYSEHKATLIFCNSRKSSEMTAAVLEKHSFTLFPLSAPQTMQLMQLAQRLHDPKLRKLVTSGVAFHHAGLTYDDRTAVEDCFRKGSLNILVSTNTLAMGVNLPAHLVVIKSTEFYCHGKFEEYSESTLLQMIGRAGRPQYDTKGIAVVLTQTKNVHKYERLMDGKMPVESHLHECLAEHLNSEIALNTINNLEMAMQWIRSTFLYVRSVRNPVKYGFEANLSKELVERKLEEMCLKQINSLNDANLITMDITNGLSIQTTAYGKLMARYYICFETMKLFRQIRGDETYLEMFNLIIRCKEFTEFSLRTNEKKYLNELNVSPIRFPIPGRIKTNADKVSCLIQATLGNCVISSAGLAQEALKMLRIGARVSKCLLEYMRLSENELHDFRGGCYKALLYAVTIAKCFHAKLWENSEYASKQLHKIGAVYSRLLASSGKTTLKSLAQTEAGTIELILKKQHPFGNEVLQNLMSFPEYTLEVNLKFENMLHVIIKQVNGSYNCSGSGAVLIIGDANNNLLLSVENLENIIYEFGYFERHIRITNLEVEYINVHVIHMTLVGVDTFAKILLCKTKSIDTDVFQDAAKKVATKRKQKQQKTKIVNKKRLKDTVPEAVPVNETLSIDYSFNNRPTTSTKSYQAKLEQMKFTKSKISATSTTNEIPTGQIKNVVKTGVAENQAKETSGQAQSLTSFIGFQLIEKSADVTSEQATIFSANNSAEANQTKNTDISSGQPQPLSASIAQKSFQFSAGKSNSLSFDKDAERIAFNQPKSAQQNAFVENHNLLNPLAQSQNVRANVAVQDRPNEQFYEFPAGQNLPENAKVGHQHQDKNAEVASMQHTKLVASSSALDRTSQKSFQFSARQSNSLSFAEKFKKPKSSAQNACVENQDDSINLLEPLAQPQSFRANLTVEDQPNEQFYEFPPGQNLPENAKVRHQHQDKNAEVASVQNTKLVASSSALDRTSQRSFQFSARQSNSLSFAEKFKKPKSSAQNACVENQDDPINLLDQKNAQPKNLRANVAVEDQPNEQFYEFPAGQNLPENAKLGHQHQDKNAEVASVQNTKIVASSSALDRTFQKSFQFSARQSNSLSFAERVAFNQPKSSAKIALVENQETPTNLVVPLVQPQNLLENATVGSHHNEEIFQFPCAQPKNLPEKSTIEKQLQDKNTVLASDQREMLSTNISIGNETLQNNMLECSLGQSMPLFIDTDAEVEEIFGKMDSSTSFKPIAANVQNQNNQTIFEFSSCQPNNLAKNSTVENHTIQEILESSSNQLNSFNLSLTCGQSAILSLKSIFDSKVNETNFELPPGQSNSVLFKKNTVPLKKDSTLAKYKNFIQKKIPNYFQEFSGFADDEEMASLFSILNNVENDSALALQNANHGEYKSDSISSSDSLHKLFTEIFSKDLNEEPPVVEPLDLSRNANFYNIPPETTFNCGNQYANHNQLPGRSDNKIPNLTTCLTNKISKDQPQYTGIMSMNGATKFDERNYLENILYSATKENLKPPGTKSCGTQVMLDNFKISYPAMNNCNADAHYYVGYLAHQALMKLNTKQRNFTNYKKLYQHFEKEENRQNLYAEPFHPACSVKIQNQLNASVSFNNMQNVSITTMNSMASASALSTGNNNTSGEDPYRLRLFQNDLSRTKVNSINQEVMQYVLEQKCLSNMQPPIEEEIDAYIENLSNSSNNYSSIINKLRKLSNM